MATKAWQKRVDEGRPHHGLGPSDYFPGNVQHLVSPIVGMLRLDQADGRTMTPENLEYVIDRLAFVLELAREEDAAEQEEVDYGWMTSRLAHPMVECKCENVVHSNPSDRACTGGER